MTPLRGYALNHSRKYQTRVEMVVSNKRTSLQNCSYNYHRKKLYKIATKCDCYKTFFHCRKGKKARLFDLGNFFYRKVRPSLRVDLLDVLSNIWPSRKKYPRSNSLAYCEHSMTKKKLYNIANTLNWPEGHWENRYQHEKIFTLSLMWLLNRLDRFPWKYFNAGFNNFGQGLYRLVSFWRMTAMFAFLH